MIKVTWSTEARRNLKDIIRYFRVDSPQKATWIANMLYDSVGRLGFFPLSGRIVPEYARQDLRKVIVHGFRVMYVYRDEEVKVVAIFHGRQLLSDSFKVNELVLAYM